ncbi:MAG: galactose oxidase-like domain-containing protein, partial [Pyrinomonadaceae bacterium]
NDPRSWNPADQSVAPLSKPGFDTFCTGHTFLADGRLFVAGGHMSNNEGLARALAYNPFNNTWSAFPDMNAGRWYPTTTVLGNGDVLVVSGSIDNSIGVNKLPQVFQIGSNTWRDLTSAQLGQALYPAMMLAPNGRVFNPGPDAVTRYLDTSGTGAWSVVANRPDGYRGYGSAVMYAPGKIIAMGGGDPPKNSAEVIDLNQANPSWRAVDSMTFARRQINALLLPDGKVLVTGGTSGTGFNNKDFPVFEAELWDPATETWSVMDSAAIPRLYHSATVLLPDGRVLSTGGNGYPDTEIYSPPYLFKGARPTITSAPQSVAYGQSFFVETPDAAAIAKVRMIRLSSTTHAFNMGQHPAEPSFAQASGGLNVTAPTNGNAAPPGHYLLFILNGSGLPSIGKVIQISGDAPPPPPPSGTPKLALLSPHSAVAGGPGFTLTVTGSNFVASSVVRWKGANRPTTFVNATTVTAAIPASDIAAAGTANVTVANGGSVSNAIVFQITPSASPPTLSTMSPASATAGGGGFTLSVTGNNFVSGSVVRWRGANRTTTFVSTTHLNATIPASDISAAGTARVSVANPGGVVSNGLTFTITSSSGKLTSMSPASQIQGSAGFTLSVTGSGFVNGSVVRWRGANRTTSLVSSTNLNATISAVDLATAGTANVSVITNGVVSNTLTFTITPSTPPAKLTSLSPPSAKAGSLGFTLTVNGSNFVAGSIVRWKGVNRTTAFVSATQLTAAIPASDIASAGTANVTVSSPSGAITNVLTFTITPP